jgi:hypothetical protein
MCDLDDTINLVELCELAKHNPRRGRGYHITVCKLLPLLGSLPALWFSIYKIGHLFTVKAYFLQHVQSHYLLGQSPGHMGYTLS